MNSVKSKGRVVILRSDGSKNSPFFFFIKWRVSNLVDIQSNVGPRKLQRDGLEMPFWLEQEEGGNQNEVSRKKKGKWGW